MSLRKNGFTLLEVCLALMIGLLLVTLAVPSIVGAVAEQRLKHSFEEFDAFVQSARMKSVRERRDVVMFWDDKGLTLASTAPDTTSPMEDKSTEDQMRFTFPKDHKYAIDRSAALMKHPPAEWIFWKNGLCEPVKVSFFGPAGKWIVQYNPLSVRGTFLHSETK